MQRHPVPATPVDSDRTPRTGRSPAPAGAVALALTSLAAAAGVAQAQTPVETPAAAEADLPARMMVEAVIQSFDLTGRRVYFSPALELTPEIREAGIQGRPRHPPEALERVRTRYDATIADLEEVIECADPARAATCRLPGDGILFHFTMPDPMQNNILPVRVVVVHDARGRDGQLLREGWGFHLRKHPDGNWSVARKELLVTVDHVD